jgi:hypothetical protein
VMFVVVLLIVNCVIPAVKKECSSECHHFL